MIPVYLLIYSDGSADIVPQVNHSLYIGDDGWISVERGREFSQSPLELYACNSATQAVAVFDLMDPILRRAAATRLDILIDLKSKASPRHGTTAEASDNPSGAATVAPAAPEGNAT